MKILVVSDIHCLSAALKSSNAYAGTPGGSFLIEHREVSRNLIFGMADALSDWVGKIDALLCVGDIAHQAQALPMIVAWNDLNHVAVELEIPVVLAVTGNHDVNTRVANVNDAIDRVDLLKSLRPRYPINIPDKARQYFADGVSFCDVSGVRIILVDTTRTHGLGRDEATTRTIFARGEITPEMADLIITYATEAPVQHVCVAMHHHPKRVDDVKDTDYDEIERGPEILTRLANCGKTCFVIHGHKHFVKHGHFASGAISPFVFSCASFSAYPYPDQALHFANQFHIIGLDTAEVSYPSGTILTWSRSGSQWVQSAKPEMLYEVKFGAPLDYKSIAKAISELSFQSSVAFDHAAQEVPELNRLSASCRDPLQEELYELGLSIVWARGSFQKISRN